MGRRTDPGRRRARLTPVALWCAASLAAAAVSAQAQPTDLAIAPATTDAYPPGVKVGQTASGPVFVDGDGRTLYGMDLRTLLRWSPDPAQYCRDACATQWEPLLAPAGSQVNIAYPTVGAGSRAMPPEGFVNPAKAPDWTIITGPQGPQWVYKGWHMVFRRKGDQPGSTAFDGADNFTWNTLKFVPPVPDPVMPKSVSTVLVGGAYAFADTNGRVLFGGDCGDRCSGWVPLPAGWARRGLGDWSVGRQGDVAQWRYRGRPVYVSQADDKASVPEGAEILRP